MQLSLALPISLQAAFVSDVGYLKDSDADLEQQVGLETVLLVTTLDSLTLVLRICGVRKWLDNSVVRVLKLRLQVAAIYVLDHELHLELRLSLRQLFVRASGRLVQRNNVEVGQVSLLCVLNRHGRKYDPNVQLVRRAQTSLI